MRLIFSFIFDQAACLLPHHRVNGGVSGQGGYPDFFFFNSVYDVNNIYISRSFDRLQRLSSSFLWYHLKVIKRAPFKWQLAPFLPVRTNFALKLLAEVRSNF